MFILRFICTIYTRGVHGSVRFGLDSKNQPNRISVFLININRTGPETGSNQTGPVRLNLVFLEKTGKPNPFLYGFFFWFFLNLLSFTLKFTAT